MSVLSFPRIYFQGFMCWDPPTGNNNDQFPTYAYDKAELNWGYLALFGINRSNFGVAFRPWVTSNLQWNADKNGNPVYSPPGEWNFFGTNGCYFVQYQDKKSRITGGATALGSPTAQDALFGKPIELIGDLFGSPEAARPGRLVDNNPASSYSSQVYFNSMRFGDEQTGIAGPCYRRMHSRFIGTLRNPNLPSAGHVAVTWQTCFPQKGLVINNAGNSQLLSNLQKMIDSGKAKGVMVRFNTYLSLYYQNGYFNGAPKKPGKLSDLPDMYKEAFLTGNQFTNPCYSRVLGVIGPWYDDELVSVPEGRFLATAVPLPVKPNATAHAMRLTSSMVHGGPAPGLAAPAPAAAPAPVATPTINVPPASPTPVVMLGVTLAEVDYTNHIIFIDALNTFPEWFWQGDKMDLGDITLCGPGQQRRRAHDDRDAQVQGLRPERLRKERRHPRHQVRPGSEEGPGKQDQERNAGRPRRARGVYQARDRIGREAMVGADRRPWTLSERRPVEDLRRVGLLQGTAGIERQAADR